LMNESAWILCGR